MSFFPKKFLQQYLPKKTDTHQYWLIRKLGEYFHHPRLWHLNRRSAAGATGIGLFIAFLPIPFQMVLVSLAALWLRVNLPLSLALIFITNPLTMGPAFFFCYKLGATLTDAPALLGPSNYESHLQWLSSQLSVIWWPLWLGSLITGTVLAISGYLLVRTIWASYIKNKRGTLLKRITRRRLLLNG